jgi:hypothetical protein
VPDTPKVKAAQEALLTDETARDVEAGDAQHQVTG